MRQFHDFTTEKKRKHSYLIPVQSTAIAGNLKVGDALCLRQVDGTRRLPEEQKCSSQTLKKILGTHSLLERDPDFN